MYKNLKNSAIYDSEQSFLRLFSPSSAEEGQYYLINVSRNFGCYTENKN